MSRPYYERSPGSRRQHADIVRLVNSFGTHRICPRQGCRRAGACADLDRRHLPFCFHHYRGALRFVVLAAAEAHGLKPAAPGDADDHEEDEPGPPPSGLSLVDRLLASGVPAEALERPAEAGPCEWAQERDPAAVALMDAIAAARERRLARRSGRGGRPPASR